MDLSVDASSLNLLYVTLYQRDYEFMSGNIPTGIVYRKVFTVTEGCDKPRVIESIEHILRFPETIGGNLALDTITITNPWDESYSG